jgi:hypothetical protein
MRILALVGILAASTGWAQEPASNPPQPPSQVQAQAPAASQKQTITIPVGTRIPLALASPITTKSARPGNAVRAVTGFPVTVGTHLAIPVGTYVEGVIDKVTKGGRSGPSLQMHFTRMLYANGYTVTIDGANTQAKALSPGPSSPEPVALASESGSSYALAPQQSSTIPTVQPPASHTGAIVGLAVASAAAVIAVAVLGHRHGASNGVLFDTGWQFEMVLESPLSVDAASVAAALATPSAQ